jgi:protein-L-isoaspartate(D-aspartate) O-methyltransferase
MVSSKRSGGMTEFAKQRTSMVSHQLESRGIMDRRVLEAMAHVPREQFVPRELWDEAYCDGPLPIGYSQTISQPYTVAMMCEALSLQGHEKVLEIGTGSGYAASVLGRLAREVHTIERIPELAHSAELHIQALGIQNVHVHVGDGSMGLPENSPFEAIVVTAGGPSLPPALSEQLEEGGRIVMPIGPMHNQKMCRFTKRHGDLQLEDLGAFCFVPLIGEDAWPDVP